MTDILIKSKQNAMKKEVFDINLRHLHSNRPLPESSKLMLDAAKLDVILSFTNLRSWLESEI